MPGMNATTGREMDDLPHIWQSVRDIITTRLGTRTMRRDYGSLFPELIDHPMNEATKLRMAAATFMALIKFEPRVRFTEISFTVAMDGTVQIDVSGVRTGGPRVGQSFSLSGVL